MRGHPPTLIKWLYLLINGMCFVSLLPRPSVLRWETSYTGQVFIMKSLILIAAYIFSTASAQHCIGILYTHLRVGMRSAEKLDKYKF